MESSETLKIQDRYTTLEHWLRTFCNIKTYQLEKMPGDASFRQYYRLHAEATSYVLMDAPAHENCAAFVAIASVLRAGELRAPHIFAADVAQGFLLLSDFGDATYLKSLRAETADHLYQRALQSLSVLQACKPIDAYIIPPFTEVLMWQEWAWFKEWFLEKWLHIEPEIKLDDNYKLLVQSALSQPQVFMHRDFHSANLMVLENNEVGILDFQDAFIGPLTYDVVSLLRDCYIAWPQVKVKTWALYYLEILHSKNIFLDVDDKIFLRWFDLMGVQRHLKALLTFARKHVRDQQSQYLNHIPRTLNYLLEVTQNYPELSDLYHFLQNSVLPQIKIEISTCVQ